MAESIWRPIRADLRRILLSVPGCPAMKWEGKRYNPTAGIPYGREKLSTGTATTETLGSLGHTQENGIYMLDFLWPANGLTSEAEDFADRVRLTFWHGREIASSGADFIRGGVLTSWRMDAVEDDASYQIPVRVEFYIRRRTRQLAA